MERWLSIPHHDGYEVSDHGNVRNRRTGHVLRPGKANKSGHLTVMLGRGRKRYVHDLVARAFVGPKPSPHHEVRHCDGDSGNNFWRNLEWATRGRNIQDLKYHAGKDGCLKVDQIRQIKRLLQRPYHGIGADLALRFGVSQCTISAIRNDKNHKDVA